MGWLQQLGPLFAEYHGRVLLPAAAIVLVAARFFSRGSESRTVRVSLIVALVALAVLSGLVWHNFFNFHYGTFVNTYEHFHYYTATKYADELGYFDLYAAALAADAAGGSWYRPSDGMIRDLRTNRMVPVQTVFDDAPRVRGRFSDARWREFSRDIDWFKSSLGPRAWNRALRDHGYNGTPVWTTVVGAITNTVPTGRGMTLLAALDSILLLLAVAAVCRAFGLWPGLLTAIALGSSYLMAHVHMKGALLRTDFVVCLVVATCMLRLGRFGTAGVLVGYSALSRIFPLVFVFGLVAKALWAIAERRRNRLAPYLRFGIGLSIATGALVGLSLVDHGGPGVWRDFGTKISMHRERPHIWDLGLATITNATFDAGSVAPERRSSTTMRDGRPLPGPVLSFDAAERRAPLRALLAAIGLAAGALVCRRLPDHAALAFGFVPFFLLVSPTYYYYILLLLPLLYFAERLETSFGVAGTSWIFAMSIAGFLLYSRFDQYFPTTYWNALLTAGLVALTVADAAFRERSGRFKT